MQHLGHSYSFSQLDYKKTKWQNQVDDRSITLATQEIIGLSPIQSQRTQPGMPSRHPSQSVAEKQWVGAAGSCGSTIHKASRAISDLGALFVAVHNVLHALLQQVSPPMHGSCAHRSGALSLPIGWLLCLLVLLLFLTKLLQTQNGWPGGSIGMHLGHW